MTERQSPDQFLIRIFIFQSIDHDRICSTDSLVTRTGIAHDRNHCPTHTGITRGRRLGNDMGKDRIPENAMTKRAVHGLAQAMTIVTLQRFSRCTHIIVFGFPDKLKFI